MVTKRKTASLHPLIQNPLVRYVGQHAPAHQVLHEAMRHENLPITVRASAVAPSSDYALIDPTLTVQPRTLPVQGEETMPPSGAGYAAFTPSQRYALLQWLNSPADPAPAAFQQLYLAQLEVTLLEREQKNRVRHEVQRLQEAPAWRHHLGLARLRLLVYWLARDSSGLADWLSSDGAPGPLLGMALGLQALLAHPLQAAQLPPLFHHWSLEAAFSNPALLTLRLSSLAATLGREPLSYALAQLPASAQQPQPWRSQHRDLRFALPQPDLRLIVEPLLRDLTTESADHRDRPDEEDEKSPTGAGWQLVLEFGESRSDFFALALMAAQKQPGYVALMDEDRHMIHRVHFQKGEVRRFWRLWDYVQSWSSAKVYINGDEISKWELYGRLWQVR